MCQYQTVPMQVIPPIKLIIQRASIRVLVIDNYGPGLAVLADHFSMVGSEAATFDTYEAGLAAFERDPDRWDAAVIDYNMYAEEEQEPPPVLTPFDVGEAIQERRDIPIIYTGTYDMRGPSFNRRGFQGFLWKPFLPSELDAMIRKFL